MPDFVFYTRFNQVELLGVKAKNIAQLLENIRTVPEASIYYHTHKFLETHHFISSDSSNDFSHWINDILNEKKLGELTSSIDIIQFSNLEDLRTEFIRLLEEFILDSPIRDCPSGQEFHFMSCKTFILPTPNVAHNLYEFRLLLEKISVRSLYFHIIEAKLRLKHGDNDFSRWIRDIGKKELADEISGLDPYAISLGALRKNIISIIDKYII